MGLSILDLPNEILIKIMEKVFGDLPPYFVDGSSLAFSEYKPIINVIWTTRTLRNAALSAFIMAKPMLVISETTVLRVPIVFEACARRVAVVCTPRSQGLPIGCRLQGGCWRVEQNNQAHGSYWRPIHLVNFVRRSLPHIEHIDYYLDYRFRLSDWEQMCDLIRGVPSETEPRTNSEFVAYGVVLDDLQLDALPADEDCTLRFVLTITPIDMFFFSFKAHLKAIAFNYVTGEIEEVWLNLADIAQDSVDWKNAVPADEVVYLWKGLVSPVLFHEQSGRKRILFPRYVSDSRPHTEGMLFSIRGIEQQLEDPELWTTIWESCISLDNLVDEQNSMELIDMSRNFGEMGANSDTQG